MQTLHQLGQIAARQLARIFALAHRQADENLVLQRQHQLLEALQEGVDVVLLPGLESRQTRRIDRQEVAQAS